MLNYICNTTVTYYYTYFNYSFPKNNIDNWVKSLKLNNFNRTSNIIGCSLHFKEDCFVIYGSMVRLKKGAVPSLFETTSSSLDTSSSASDFGMAFKETPASLM